LIAVVVFGIAWAIVAGTGHSEERFAAAGKSEPFVVAELFTSEGCSSCPPAERLLRQITETARREQKRIFTLEFHVDYWNGLGWKDLLSAPAFTRRQRDYARAFRSGTVYTPQMVVNGAREFSGGDEGAFQRAAREFLAVPAGVELDLKLEENTDTSVRLGYELSRVPENCVLNVALIQRYAANKVSFGENSGRFLEHTNVVRAFETLGLKEASGTAALARPRDERSGDFAVVVYLADAVTMNIKAAAMLEL
jgi:hypothetical protein